MLTGVLPRGLFLEPQEKMKLLKFGETFSSFFLLSLMKFRCLTNRDTEHERLFRECTRPYWWVFIGKELLGNSSDCIINFRYQTGNMWWYFSSSSGFMWTRKGYWLNKFHKKKLDMICRANWWITYNRRNLQIFFWNGRLTCKSCKSCKPLELSCMLSFASSPLIYLSEFALFCFRLLRLRTRRFYQFLSHV